MFIKPCCETCGGAIGHIVELFNLKRKRLGLQVIGELVPSQVILDSKQNSSLAKIFEELCIFERFDDCCRMMLMTTHIFHDHL